MKGGRVARRRGLFRLAEVEIELAKATQNLEPKAVLLTDLQQGALSTVAEFPRFRNGVTPVPQEHWKAVDLDEFSERPARRSGQTDFLLDSDWMVREERKKLKTTVLACHRRDRSQMDPDHGAFFEEGNHLKENMSPEDWEHILLKCFGWHKMLLKEAEPSFVPMVTSAELERYLQQVEADRDGPVARPGRPPADFWLSIFGEAIRQLHSDSKQLNDGNVSPFAKRLHAWAIDKFRTNVGVPGPATIADRLRAVRDSKWIADR